MDKNYKILCVLARDVYNISSVLFEYCKKSGDEEIAKLQTIVKILHKKADDMNFECMKLEEHFNTPPAQ
ncbi:MAG: hypothetical protein OSJ27_01190 [Candidatus Gastranaerophilales bacterium]|nr:hypothetical protein [Candidatus Gastranaerophilales bacterium]